MSCSGGAPKIDVKPGTIYVKCQLKMPNVNANEVWVPKGSYWWRQIHESFCEMEKRHMPLPEWSQHFYQQSFPNQTCVGSKCNVFL
jgi:hypothetical protein